MNRLKIDQINFKEIEGHNNDKQERNWKDADVTGLGLRYYPEIRPEILKKTTKRVRHDSRLSGRISTVIGVSKLQNSI
jgi:hypothetical protein